MSEVKPFIKGKLPRLIEAYMSLGKIGYSVLNEASNNITGIK